jgi:hypothetical protein
VRANFFLRALLLIHANWFEGANSFFRALFVRADSFLRDLSFIRANRLWRWFLLTCSFPRTSLSLCARWFLLAHFFLWAR